MNWYLKVLKEHYADFKGRARREEYWMFVLFNIIVSFVIVLVFAGIGIAIEVPEIIGLSYIYYLAILIPSISVVVRRLHDAGKSGWYYFISLIPIVGFIWLLVLLCTDSENGPNKWGDNPKGIGNDGTINKIGSE